MNLSNYYRNTVAKILYYTLGKSEPAWPLVGCFSTYYFDLVVKFVQASASTFSALNSIQLAFLIALQSTHQDSLVNNLVIKSDEIPRRMTYNSILFLKEWHTMHDFEVFIIYLIKHGLLGLGVKKRRILPYSTQLYQAIVEHLIILSINKYALGLDVHSSCLPSAVQLIA